MKILNTKYQIPNTQEIKNFIKVFNFPDPDWENLPIGFPDVSKKGLNKEESYLLEGIILAWLAGEKRGKMVLLKNSIKSGVISFIILAILSLFINFTQGPGWQYTKQVSAATISATLKTTGISSDADEINIFLDSTISGILKRK